MGMGAYSVKAAATGLFARNLFHVTLGCCRTLAFPLLRGLLVELAAAQFRKNARLFTGALEATQRYIELFVVAYSNCRHIGKRPLW